MYWSLWVSFYSLLVFQLLNIFRSDGCRIYSIQFVRLPEGPASLSFLLLSAGDTWKIGVCWSRWTVCLYADLNIFKQMENSRTISPCFLALVYNFKFLDLIETWWRNQDIHFFMKSTKPGFSSCSYWMLLRGSLPKYFENLVQFSARERFPALFQSEKIALCSKAIKPILNCRIQEYFLGLNPNAYLLWFRFET